MEAESFHADERTNRRTTNGQTDGRRTDRYDEANRRFSNFASGSKKKTETQKSFDTKNMLLKLHRHVTYI